MSEAREIILAKLREARGGNDGVRQRLEREIAARLKNPAPVLIPERARVTGEERIRLFIRMAEEVQTDVVRIPHPREVAGATVDYLLRHNLPMKLVLAPDPLLDGTGFAEHATLEVRRGDAEPDDPVGVTVAFSGIAETGTLMLASSPRRPALLGFLPETSIVLLPVARLDGCYEESWARLRREMGPPPRAVNLITGPSRTADIANRLTLGAHGPKRLLVLLVEEVDAT